MLLSVARTAPAKLWLSAIRVLAIRARLIATAPVAVAWTVSATITHQTLAMATQLASTASKIPYHRNRRAPRDSAALVTSVEIAFSRRVSRMKEPPVRQILPANLDAVSMESVISKQETAINRLLVYLKSALSTPCVLQVAVTMEHVMTRAFVG